MVLIILFCKSDQMCCLLGGVVRFFVFFFFNGAFNLCVVFTDNTEVVAFI